MISGPHIIWVHGDPMLLLPGRYDTIYTIRYDIYSKLNVHIQLSYNNYNFVN